MGVNKSMSIVLIAAIGKNRELGKGPELIWHLPDDLKRFKALTTGHPIIMGRKTFESISKPLPKRVNIVVTRSADFRAEGVVIAHSVEQAIELAKSFDTEAVFVIGGGEIYAQALPYATRLELTLVNAEEPSADVFFPEFAREFRVVSKEKPREENGVSYTWAVFERK
ncbi:MAG: dihydrofolate reductase [Candidatus Paceibacteria bacterium]